VQDYVTDRVLRLKKSRRWPHIKLLFILYHYVQPEPSALIAIATFFALIPTALRHHIFHTIPIELNGVDTVSLCRFGTVQSHFRSRPFSITPLLTWNIASPCTRSERTSVKNHSFCGPFQKRFHSNVCVTRARNAPVRSELVTEDIQRNLGVGQWIASVFQQKPVSIYSQYLCESVRRKSNKSPNRPNIGVRDWVSSSLK